VTRRVQERLVASTPAQDTRVPIGQRLLDLKTHSLCVCSGEDVPLTGMEFVLLKAIGERIVAQAEVIH
jgi:hypothetical protein